MVNNVVDMYNRLHTIPACDKRTDRQIDGWTDGQPSCHGIVRAMHTRRAVKTSSSNSDDANVMSLVNKHSQSDKCLGDDTKAVNRRSPNCIRKTKILSVKHGYLSHCRNFVKNCFPGKISLKSDNKLLSAELWPTIWRPN